MKIQLKPLTPLWTGNAIGKGDRILETGIIGSLRWWYEAIIRGMGYYACDPTVKPCKYDPDKGLISICHVCQLFGCTGFGRHFRLMIEGGVSATTPPLEVKMKNLGDAAHRGWRVPSSIVNTPLSVAFLPMREKLGELEITSLCYTLRFVEQHGALGGKISQGQGVVNITGVSNHSKLLDYDTWKNKIDHQPANESDINMPCAPDLRDFIGVKIQIEEGILDAKQIWNVIPLEAKVNGQNWIPKKEADWIPSAPTVRAKLRQWLHNSKNVPGFYDNLHKERHRLMGTTNSKWGDPQPSRGKERPKGSDIFVTHLYKQADCWLMRLFAFVPKHGNPVDTAVRGILLDRTELKELLKQALGGIPIDIANSIQLDRIND